MLSGECKMSNEIFGRLNVSSSFKQCIKRRAILSLKMNDNCKMNAEEMVNTYFEKCYNDVEPFINREN